MNSAGLANLGAVSSAHALVILDPLRTAGAPEMVIVTAHTADVDGAVTAFETLIDRNPDEPKGYVTATEAMLRAKAGAKALAFAEKGIVTARGSCRTAG